MSKRTYIGVENVARRVKKAYIGVDNKARKIRRAYIGDANNIARLMFTSGKNYILIGGLYGDLTVSNEDDYNAVTKLWPSMSSSAYTSNLVSKINGDIIVARGKDVTNGYGKYDPRTNTITVLPKLSTGVTLGGYTVVDMAYGNGYYFAMFYNESTYRLAYATSLDGEWTPFTSASAGFSRLQYHNGAFYLYGHSDKKVRRYTGSPPTTAESSYEMKSDHWTYKNFTVFNGKVLVFARWDLGGNGYLIYWDESSNMPSSSINGTTVNIAVVPECIVHASDRIIAVDIETQQLCYSLDGLTWTLVNTISGLRAVYYEGGVYYATQGSTVYMSKDLVTWTQIATGHATPPFTSTRKHFICTEMEDQ